MRMMRYVRWILATVVCAFFLVNNSNSQYYTATSDSLKAKTFRDWAIQKLNEKDTVAAMLLFEESLYTNPNDWLTYYNRATVNYNIGKTGSAKKDINEALELKENFVNGLYFRSMINFYDEELEHADSDLSNAIKISPKSAFLYRKRGAVRYNNGKIISALKDFNESIELNPFDPVAFYNRYVTKDAMNDKKGAKYDLLRALSLGFNPEQLED